MTNETDNTPTGGGPAKETKVDVVDTTIGRTLAGPLSPSKANAMVESSPASHRVVTKPHKTE